MQSGLIDMHIHGRGSYDTKNPSASSIQKIASLCGKAGINAILPALYPAPIRKMRAMMDAVSGAMAEGVQAGTAEVIGVYLEGPFLSPLYSGALDKSSFLKPSTDSLMRLIEGYEDIIKVIAIAPELDGSLKVIERCASMGIKVHMGHSNASYKQAVDGKKAGATGITHAFNAMRPIHHRDPGLAGLALMNPDIYIEVICDGVHICNDMLKWIFSLKPADRIIAVSDSVKGVQRIDDVLQGGKIGLEKAAKHLGRLGIDSMKIRKAVWVNPKVYLGI